MDKKQKPKKKVKYRYIQTETGEKVDVQENDETTIAGEGE